MVLAPEIHRGALAIVLTSSIEIEPWLNPLREEEVEARKLATRREWRRSLERKKQRKKKKKREEQERKKKKKSRKKTEE